MTRPKRGKGKTRKPPAKKVKRKATRRRPRKGREPNEKQRAFAHHHVAGEDGIRGNATRSAIAAGYSRKSAASQGQRLLKNAKVAEMIARVREKAEEQTIRKLRDWNEMVPDVQHVLHGMVNGGIDSSPGRVAAGREILDRALGKPKATLVHDLRGIDAALDELDEDQPHDATPAGGDDEA